MSFLKRAFSESVVNVWRNLQYSLAAVLTVVICLTMVGSALVVRQGVANFTVQWSHGVNAEIFMNYDATDTEIKTVSKKLSQSPLISSCTYLNHDQSYKLMQQLLKGSPQIAAVFTVQTVPTFFRCTLANASDGPAFFNTFKDLPGVESPAYPGQDITTMEHITSIVQKLLLAMAVFMLADSILLIFVTIRLAIFSRRREVAVMKLVGATNWFIRIPFMLEGMLEGIIGAILAGGFVFAIRNALDSLVKTGSSKGGLSLLGASVATTHDVLMSCIVLIILGAGIGCAGSFIAIRRFLDV